MVSNELIPCQLMTGYSVVGLIEQWPGKIDVSLKRPRRFIETLPRIEAGFGVSVA
jgi:hypothetical protein